MKVLFLGDVVGKPGRKLVASELSRLRTDLGLDLVLANGENASGGIGIMPKSARELFAAGVDVITTGNHVWKYREVYPYLKKETRCLRPLNYPPGSPGFGFAVYRMEGLVPFAVANLQGRTFMPPVECPFAAMDRALEDLVEDVNIVFVDFHAEATSEKQALAHYLDGRVSVIVGTHTHVPTADARIFPGGTGYITDLGMCGPIHSCLGMDPKAILHKFRTGMPSRFQVAKGPTVLQGAIFDIDDSSGQTLKAETFSYPA